MSWRKTPCRICFVSWVKVWVSHEDPTFDELLCNCIMQTTDSFISRFLSEVAVLHFTFVLFPRVQGSCTIRYYAPTVKTLISCLRKLCFLSLRNCLRSYLYSIPWIPFKVLFLDGSSYLFNSYFKYFNCTWNKSRFYFYRQRPFLTVIIDWHSRSTFDIIHKKFK